MRTASERRPEGIIPPLPRPYQPRDDFLGALVAVFGSLGKPIERAACVARYAATFVVKGGNAEESFGVSGFRCFLVVTQGLLGIAFDAATFFVQFSKLEVHVIPAGAGEL